MVRIARRGLIGVAAFGALSAVGGGIGILATNGLGMPRSLLVGTPFTSFAIPGVILLVIVGGAQVLALVSLLRPSTRTMMWSAVAGFGMLIWIITEIGLLRVFLWPQWIYVVDAVAQLGLVFVLLGILRPRSDEDNHTTGQRPMESAARQANYPEADRS